MFSNLTRRCDSAFENAVLRRCYTALSAAGFVRFQKGAVDWPFDADFHCWVGLEAALKKDHVMITPLFGLHAVPIMKLCATLERKRYRRAAPTYVNDAAELTSHAPPFRFTRHSDIDAVAARVARLYARVGLARAKSIAHYESLLPLLQARVGLLPEYPQRAAACLYLMGRTEEARSFTQRYRAGHGDTLEDFAVAFTALLDRRSVEIAALPSLGARSTRALHQQRRPQTPDEREQGFWQS
jgi:hypothetical protein